MGFPLVVSLFLFSFVTSAFTKSDTNDRGVFLDTFRALLHAKLETTSNFPTAVIGEGIISEKCRNDSIDYMNAYKFFIPWALQMSESTGKMPEGFAVLANLDSPGLFDECLGVRAPAFSGKHCTIHFQRVPTNLSSEVEESAPAFEFTPPTRTNWIYFYQVLNLVSGGYTMKQPKEADSDISSSSSPSAGFCIPSSCSAQDFRRAVADLIGNTSIFDANSPTNYSSLVSVTDESKCYTSNELDEAPQFDGQDITVLTILCILGAFVLIATIFDVWQTHYAGTNVENGIGKRSLLAFSAYTNAKRLLSTNASASDNLSCLNGVRVLSTSWIVLYHVYFIIITDDVYNRPTFIKDLETWILNGVLNATIAVDTFFVMSGLLVAFSTMKEMDRNEGSFNVFLFYLHRYLRLTIVYAFILGFIATLLVHMGSGPNWYIVQYMSEACRWNWWNNFLYVNNYVQTFPRDCMGETWYLAAEMQMFWLSPVFLYLLYRSKKLGLAFTGFIIFASLGGTLAITIVWNLPASGAFTRSDALSNPYYYRQFYVQMWTRWPPYLLGILLGWFLHITKNHKIKLTKVVVTAGWCLASSLGLAVIFGMAPYANDSAEISDPVRVLYATFHRFAWAVVIVWIIFACLHGYGGFVNRLLSWSAFNPLARLTYVVYLVHLNFLYVYRGYARKPYYYSTLDQGLLYFGVLFIVFLLAFFVCLTIELPFSNVERILLPNRKRTAPKRNHGSL